MGALHRFGATRPDIKVDGQQRAVAPQRCELVRILDERLQATGDRLAGGLAAGHEEEVVEEEVPDYATSASKQRLFMLNDDEELDNDTPWKKLNLERGVQLEIRPYVLFIERQNGDVFDIDFSPI